MLTPLSKLSRRDAVRTFGTGHQHYCDGQFVLTPTDVVCLFEQESITLSSPRDVDWVPKKHYKVNTWTVDGPPVWMPAAPEGRYQIFLRFAADVDDYWYLGAAHLSGHSHGAWPRAHFEFEQKLTKPDWIRLGGHEGWQVWGDCSAQLLPTELEKFNAILAGDGSGHLHIGMRGYEDDELCYRTNGQRAQMIYNRRRAVGELPRDESPVIFRRGANGVGGYASAELTLPAGLAAAATREYFVQGELPEWLTWETIGEGDEWLFKETITSLRHLFGHSLAEATALLEKFLTLWSERQATSSGSESVSEFFGHEAPEGAAYEIQWWAGLGNAPGSPDFLAWRQMDYERRKEPGANPRKLSQ